MKNLILLFLCIFFTFGVIEESYISDKFLNAEAQTLTTSRRISMLERRLNRYERRIGRYETRLTALYERVDSEDDSRKKERLGRFIARSERSLQRLESRVERVQRRLDRARDLEGELTDENPPQTPEPTRVPTVEPSLVPDSTPPTTVSPEEPILENPTVPVTPLVTMPPTPVNEPRPINSDQDAPTDTPSIIVTIPGIELPQSPESPSDEEEKPEEEGGPVSPGALLVMDAETGDYSQWRNPDGGGSGNHTIIDNPILGGKKAFKWVHKDGRTESASHYLPANKDLWIGWGLWVPNSFNSGFSGRGSQGLSVSQFHGHGRCDLIGIQHLRVSNGQFFWWLARAGSVKGIYPGLGAVPKERWIKLLVNVKWTTGSDGYFRFWIDGEKKLDLSGSTWSCNNGPYMKMGTYAHGYKNGDFIIGDEIRVGTSRAQVEQ